MSQRESRLNKVIGCNETGGHRNNMDYTFRKQAWEFIMAGGALFNNLDFSFSVGNESGKGDSLCPGTGGSHSLRMQYGFLRKFLEGMNVINLHPANHIIYSLEYTLCDGYGYLLSDERSQYAFYLSKSNVYRASFMVEEGQYLYELFDPVSCSCLESRIITHPGGLLVLSLSRHDIKDQEIAFRLIKEINNHCQENAEEN